jgi:hypothetical protein
MLDLAEELVVERGDVKQWLESYARHRQHWGVGISIERALDEQGLWDEFERRLYREE